MTDAPSPRCSSGSRGPFAWRCNDEYYPHIFGLVTDRQVTVDAWRAGGIKFEALYSADSASSPTPQIAGTETEQQFEDRLMKQDAADNLRLLDYIAHKIGLPLNEEMSRENFSAWFNSLSPQAQAGETKSALAPGWLAPRLDKAADRAAAMPAWLTRDELIGIIDRASGGYNPMRNAVADAILNVAQAEPETCAVLIEALRNCGCPSDRRGTIGDCQDRGTCGCSLPSTEGKSDV